MFSLRRSHIMIYKVSDSLLEQCIASQIINLKLCLYSSSTDILICRHNYFANKSGKTLNTSSAIDASYNDRFFSCFTSMHHNTTNLCVPKKYRLQPFVKYYSIDQLVPKSSEEVKKILSRPLEPISPPNSKLLRVAIIGVPNSGKSTLINTLAGIEVCSVSQKVHTTLFNARAISNEGSTQIIYLDTPGIVTPEDGKKYKLKQSHLTGPEVSLQQADLIAVLHDVTNKYTRHALDPRILRLLFLYPSIPSVLILNKEDCIKRKSLFLTLTRVLSDRCPQKTPKDKKNKQKLNDKELRELLLQQADTKLQKQNENVTCKDEVDIDSDAICKSDSTESEIFPEVGEQKSQNKRMVDGLSIDSEAIHESKKMSESYNIESDTSHILSEPKVAMEDVLSGKVKPTEGQVHQLIKGKKGWPNFQEVFMISALTGSGISELKNYFLKSARPNNWMFSDDMVTDQNPQELAVMTVRGKCLKHLSRNIPYELKFKIVHWDLSEADVLNILINVCCKNKSHVKLIIGKSGINAKNIAMEAAQDLRNIFRTEVILKVNVELLPKQ